ncbi:AraC family transcriptional regulator [Leptolyngbyaceae cyanobacterium CCMR0082]|uniref:AraC family transcriptional regulator n=1 Tax=Adonisia turfae CCMR0082 TaxID=2304604 RepID=A0A6M0S0Q5_9CYAN|nr:AraC family transcriptional regulator [Adonisia turfae]MDV3349012.1 AraC family transcriptional regulator [Leptothoe sp. LEGE 181152]NEZ62037.1 AraC family transcriptional regulator [Adonisia turfae CCMR0082]
MADLALTFSTSNLSEMFAEAQQQTGAACQSNVLESVYTLEKPFGRLTYRCIRLRQGLELSINQLQLEENLRVIQTTQNYSALGLSFCIMGEFRGQYQGSSAVQCAGPSKNFLGLSQGDFRFITDYSAKHPIYMLTINVSPEWLGELCPETIERESLGKTVNVQTSQAKILGTIGWTTPTMLAAVQQILACPYQGKVKQLYLESKTLELLALKLEQMGQPELSEDNKITLKTDDVHRLYQAREILLTDLEHPPSIIELARRVGINDFKLKRGFRQIFGTTVFGCLYDYRMERAKQLLDTHNLKVAQIAQTVGYANPSQFSAAFKRKFGFSPKNYRSQRQAL